MFNDESDPNIWKKCRKGYWPKANKLGTAINFEFANLPKVSYKELNAIVGFNSTFKHIGYTRNENDYVGFAILSEWIVDIPNDCEEITGSEYEELSKQKN